MAYSVDNTVRMNPVFTWAEGLFIMYRAEQYDVTWSSVYGGIVREFAIGDRKNMDFEALSKHVLDSPRLREMCGGDLLTILRDIDVLKKHRETKTTETTTTSALVGYRKRRTDWAVGVVSVGLSWLDFAIVDYYATRLSKPPSYAFKSILSLYMVADKRLKIDEFEAFKNAAMEQVTKKDRRAIEESWQLFVEQREHCQRRRKERKRRKSA